MFMSVLFAGKLILLMRWFELLLEMEQKVLTTLVEEKGLTR